MYPEPDSRADEFEDAVERYRSEDNPTIEDPELRDLVELASRLEETLPEDVPDPEFRANLKQDLLYGSPEHAGFPDLSDTPVEQHEPWYQRLVASPWRASAAAAACLVVILIAVMGTVNPFDWGTEGGSEEVTSFQPVGFGDANGPFVDDTALDGGIDSVPGGDQWFSASLPPLDVEHVVLHPLMLGFIPLAERQRPSVALNGAAEMVGDADMPSSISVYYFNAPPSGSNLLNALALTLNIDGELVEGNGDGTPYRFVDENDNEILLWDPASAFFQFQGNDLEDPVDDLLESGAEPEDVARRFLELIGFDFTTMEYEIERIDQEAGTEVRFIPDNLPEIGLELGLGGSVSVDNSGTIMEAQLFWLSLVEIEVVGLRDRDEIVEDIEHDHGYAPPAGDTDEVLIDAEDMMIVHVLTRLNESNFVLQPAVKVSGEYEGEVDPVIPGPARYLVPATTNDDDSDDAGNP